MKFIGHGPMLHLALDHVAAGNRFPLPHPEGRGLMPFLLAELIDKGAIVGVSEPDAPLELTEEGRALLERWDSPKFTRCYCRNRID